MILAWGYVATLGAPDYVERWEQNSQARARVEKLRAAGLLPKTKNGRVAGVLRVVTVTEIRISPGPSLDAIPSLDVADFYPVKGTSEERQRLGMMRRQIEEEA